MPIYLLHDPILKFFIFQVLIDQELVSTLIISAVVTLILAIGLTKLVEEPLKRLCSIKRKASSYSEIWKIYLK